jgi:DNA invertase Pin-like site-specific DNA recombinase
MHPNIKTRNVAIYARCASATKGPATIEDQIQRCIAFIERSGGDRSRVTTFADNGVAGRQAQRPAFASMMAAVDEGRIDAIVTPDFSRITRDSAEASEIRARLERAAIPLWMVDDR